MEKIKVAIFGSGFGRYGHLDALLTMPAYQVVAVCGSKFENYKSYKVYASNDWLKVLNENEIDMVAIAVPPENQNKILLETMKRKLAVMVEKPLCLNEKEYQLIKSQYQENKNLSAASFIFPELETWKKAKDLLNSDELGNLRTIYFDWKIESQAIKNNLKNWKSTTENGGSALFHFLPHLIHALQFFSGPLEKLSCISIPTADLGSQMGSPLCSIQILLESKVLVSINCNLAAPYGSGQSIEMNGSKGTLILENKGSDYVRGFKLKMQTADRKLELLESDMNTRLRPDLDSRTAPLMSIYERLANKKPITPSLEEALETQRIILLCEQSYRQMKWLQVKP